MPYQTVEYDFEPLIRSINNLFETEYEHVRKIELQQIKKLLNDFFPDFKCTEAIFTQNTDNELFGIQISPMFTNIECITKIFNLELSVKFDHYLIEFDSKLANMLTPVQILALMIHDINKLNSPVIIRDIVSYMDYISLTTGKEININQLQINSELFLFAIQDTARNLTSSFETFEDKEKYADDFVHSFGLEEEYENAIQILHNADNSISNQICYPNITLQWFMSKYDGLDPWMHKGIIDDLEDGIRLCGSKLVRRLINQILKKLNVFMSPDEELFYTSLTESSNNKPKKKMSLVSQLKYSGLKSLEDDVYEYRMRIKNVETEDEAINIIRQINNRMGIISDYLENEDLSDTDKERFFKLYDKYDGLREELSKKAIYSRKMYGLFVDYNALQQMSNNGLTMNTYY